MGPLALLGDLEQSIRAPSDMTHNWPTAERLTLRPSLRTTGNWRFFVRFRSSTFTEEAWCPCVNTSPVFDTMIPLLS